MCVCVRERERERERARESMYVRGYKMLACVLKRGRGELQVCPDPWGQQI